MTSQTSKITVVHANNKLIEKAWNSYNLPDDHTCKIDKVTYVKLVSIALLQHDLKHGYVKF